jgi:hypothetical protein
MVEKLSLEWSYTPANFFEEPFEYSENGWVVEIGDGRIVATFSGVTGEQVESACREKHEEVSARFLGAQLLNHQPYQLSDYKTTRARPDGSVEVGISFGATLCISDGRCDVMIRDAAGNVTTDTKKERVERRKEFARRASKHWKVSVVPSLLKSYNAAVNDPRNELTYLYEIRDALAKEFGGAGGVCSALGITKNQWGEMGRLANKVPLAQGRHRGQSVGQLRDAMPAELDEGRRIAKLMVERYFDYLDKLASAGPTHAA